MKLKKYADFTASERRLIEERAYKVREDFIAGALSSGVDPAKIEAWAADSDKRAFINGMCLFMACTQLEEEGVLDGRK